MGLLRSSPTIFEQLSSVLRSILKCGGFAPRKNEIRRKAHYDLQNCRARGRKPYLEQRAVLGLLHDERNRYSDKESTADALYHNEPCFNSEMSLMEKYEVCSAISDIMNSRKETD